MYIASDHIQKWITIGDALIVSVDISAQLDKWLMDLPWLPSRSGLDWGQMCSRQTSLASLTEPKQMKTFLSTSFDCDPYLIFLFAANEPCIACKSEFAIQNIDYAFWKAPGNRYMFGADIRNGEIVPNFSRFAEYDGSDTVTAAVRRC